MQRPSPKIPLVHHCIGHGLFLLYPRSDLGRTETQNNLYSRQLLLHVQTRLCYATFGFSVGTTHSRVSVSCSRSHDPFNSPILPHRNSVACNSLLPPFSTPHYSHQQNLNSRCWECFLTSGRSLPHT